MQGLVHKLGKNEIAKSCELALIQLDKYTVPALTEVNRMFSSGLKPSSSEMKEFQSSMRRLVKGSGANMLETVESRMKNAEHVLKGISKRSETLYGDQESTLAMSYQKATYLRIVAGITFATEYARRWLNYLLVVEIGESAKDTGYIARELAPGEIKYVQTHFEDFCIVLNALSKDFAEICKAVDELPDAAVTALTEKTFAATMGDAKIDPLSMNAFFDSARQNPFYLLGVMVAAWQVKSFNASQEEYEMLMMRKMDLEQRQKGNPDPHREALINSMAERIKRLRMDLDQLEEKYGIH